MLVNSLITAMLTLVGCALLLYLSEFKRRSRSTRVRIGQRAVLKKATIARVRKEFELQRSYAAAAMQHQEIGLPDLQRLHKQLVRASVQATAQALSIHENEVWAYWNARAR